MWVLCVCVIQRYSLAVIAMDGGGTPRSSTTTVTVHVVDDESLLPPVWQTVRGYHIDDLRDVSVREDATVNTYISNTDSLRLEARSSQGRVKYHLSNIGPAELNGNSAFKIPSPNRLNDPLVMPIATTSRNLDASTVPSYVLRCRAFVRICLLSYVSTYSIVLLLFIYSFIHSFILKISTWPIDSSNTIKSETD